MSRDKITSLVDSVANMLADNEKIAIPLLAVKVRKLAESHSYDQTLIAMANVISKLEDNNKLLISRSDFKNIYQRLYTRGTRFTEFFQDELGIVKEVPKIVNKHELPIVDTFKSVADPILSNALTSVFDNKIPLKLFSKEIAKRAESIVTYNLDVWNLSASKVNIENGNEHFIVVKADYDTPKGITSILVPVEINKDRVLEPSIFMGNSGPQELNHVNIKNYITTCAGNKLNIRANDVIDVLTHSISQNKDISDVEFALTKINASRETKAPFFSDQIIGQGMTKQDDRPDVTLPKLGEFHTFAEKFESPVGVANFKFGVDKVNLAREVIVRNLDNFGFKSPQVSIVNADKNSISFAVSIGGKVAFTVPVKIANNKVINPEVLICNGSVHSFSKLSLHKLFSKNETDYKAAAVASPSYGLKPSELINNIREAVTESNYAKAEDALNILMQSGDEKAYRIALSIYMNGLNIEKKAAPETTCAMIVSNSNTKHPVCGHTGLPLHKVYQDNHGNCHPLYRKGMEESTSSAYFMNSKIFG